jgi:hypothetical protein
MAQLNARQLRADSWDEDGFESSHCFCVLQKKRDEFRLVAELTFDVLQPSDTRRSAMFRLESLSPTNPAIRRSIVASTKYLKISGFLVQIQLPCGRSPSESRFSRS